MFIKVTFNNRETYINVAHIEGFREHGQHTKIWLSDGDIIEVDESLSEILKRIEEVKHEKADC